MSMYMYIDMYENAVNLITNYEPQKHTKLYYEPQRHIKFQNKVSPYNTVVTYCSFISTLQ